MGTQHTCDCSAEACDGAEDSCSAKGPLFLWTTECNTCQCPMFPTVPTSCKPKPKPIPTPVELDIPNTANGLGFTTLVTALKLADLDETLSNPPNEGPFTVMAPTNQAFDELEETFLNCLLLPRFVDVLQNILLYHVANELVLAEDLSNDQGIPMLNSESILIKIDNNDGTVKINNRSVVETANVMATNGVIHAIDRVLLPPGLNIAEFLDTCASSAASGCYMSQSVRDAGYQVGACDCSMTEEECNAEPKDGLFPMWVPNGFADVCLCDMGFGCYQLAPTPPETQHTCDCSSEACAGGEDYCSAKGASYFWVGECTSCQCPFEYENAFVASAAKKDEYAVLFAQESEQLTNDRKEACKPKPNPEPAPSTSSGCYVSQSVRDAGYQNGACDCQMTEEECNAEPKEGPFPIWSDGCEGICLCSEGAGCYQLSPEPVETQHTCDCSAEACAGAEDSCAAKGSLFLWTTECETCQCPMFPTVPTSCKAKLMPTPELTGDGCYQLAPTPPETQHTCDCSSETCAGGEDYCSAKGSGYVWTDECTSCQCPSMDDTAVTAGYGCYQLASSPPETQHTCDCSSEACVGGEDYCSAKGAEYFWTDECT